MLKVTRHFEDRWREYFKEKPPSSYRILQIINQSIWLQRCRLLFEADGTQYKLLATYWHPKRNLVIKVDWLENEVVTVITPKTKTGITRQKPEARRKVGFPSPRE